MKASTIGIILSVSVALFAPGINAAGFKQITVSDAGEADLTVGLWYPSSSQVPSKPNTRYGLAVALDAPITDSNGGLILISHGYSGWFAGHADTAIALANAGYIVAAPSHAGNTGSDMSSPPQKWLLDRPKHISRVIDYLLSNEPVSSAVVPDKIGVYGFSAGGNTAVGLIGGVPDLQLAKDHCIDNPKEFVCSEGLIDAMLGAKMDELPAAAWGADKRIQAAAIAAPGWTFAYPEASLTNVTADVQLWSGMLDESVPTESNAALLAANLPNEPEKHWIDKANHYAFLIVPCRDVVKQEAPAEYALLCTDAPGFDAFEFHTQMNAEMVRFFNKSLDIHQ